MCLTQNIVQQTLGVSASVTVRSTSADKAYHQRTRDFDIKANITHTIFCL